MVKLLHYKRSGLRNKVGLAAPVWLLGKVRLKPPAVRDSGATDTAAGMTLQCASPVIGFPSASALAFLFLLLPRQQYLFLYGPHKSLDH